MAITVIPTSVINFGDLSLEVAKMSPELQQMVQYFDDWRSKEIEATSNLLLARAGLRDIQKEMGDALGKEIEAARAAQSPVPVNTLAPVSPAAEAKVKGKKTKASA